VTAILPWLKDRSICNGTGQLVYTGLGGVVNMVQQNPERIDEILKLVDQLSPEEHDALEQEMKLRWLRRALDEGEKDSAEGKVVSLDELERRLDAKRKAILESQK